jgi:hypothetical protein
MSVNYSVSVRNNRLQQVINAVDGGVSNGFIQFLALGNLVLSTMQLARPSMTITNGVATFNGLSLIDPSAAASGPAVAAQVTDSAGNIIISGLNVNTDILMSPNNNIVAGQTVALTAATITGN